MKKDKRRPMKRRFFSSQPSPRVLKKSPRDEWREWWDTFPLDGLSYREGSALKKLSWECRWVIKEPRARVLLLLKIYMKPLLETEFTHEEQQDIRRLVGEGKLETSSAENLPPIITHSEWLGTDFTRPPKRYYLIANPNPQLSASA